MRILSYRCMREFERTREKFGEARGRRASITQYTHADACFISLSTLTGIITFTKKNYHILFFFLTPF